MFKKEMTQHNNQIKIKLKSSILLSSTFNVYLTDLNNIIILSKNT